jgi:hypothetical protein
VLDEITWEHEHAEGNLAMDGVVLENMSGLLEAAPAHDSIE